MSDKQRILIADDSEMNRAILTEMLGEKYEILEAENGQQAIEMIEQNSDIDLLLLDIMMPNMDGYGATRQIRALPDAAKAGIPIFAMTANAFEEDRQNALKAGMDGHIAKPLDIPHLLQVLADVLKS